MKLLFDAKLPGAYLLSLTPEEAGKLSVILDIHELRMRRADRDKSAHEEAEFAANARREIMGEPICNVATIQSNAGVCYTSEIDEERNRLAKLIESEATK